MAPQRPTLTFRRNYVNGAIIMIINNNDIIILQM